MNFHAPNTFFTLLFACFILVTSTLSADAKDAYNNLKGLAPNKILGLYLYAMENADDSANLQIYTKATQEWKKTWSVNRTQMANSARGLISCGKGETITNGNYAVIRYRIQNRECNPYYLKKEDGAWRLDFLTMMKTIRFNQKNLWHFSSRTHPYMFAFKDMIFDKNGYPH